MLQRVDRYTQKVNGTMFANGLTITTLGGWKCVLVYGNCKATDFECKATLLTPGRQRSFRKIKVLRVTHKVIYAQKCVTLRATHISEGP